MDPTVFGALVTVLLGGGAVGGYVAFKRAPKERESLAVETMRTVNSELRDLLSERDAEIGRLQSALREERQDCQEQIRVLRERVAVCEDILVRQGHTPPAVE